MKRPKKSTSKVLMEAVLAASEETGLTLNEICMAILSAANPDSRVVLRITTPRKRKGRK